MCKKKASKNANQRQFLCVPQEFRASTVIVASATLGYFVTDAANQNPAARKEKNSSPLVHSLQYISLSYSSSSHISHLERLCDWCWMRKNLQKKPA